MLNKEFIINLLKENGQAPHYMNSRNTIIGTRSKGVFYVLSYDGAGRIGWSVSESVVQEIKSYPKHFILLINTRDGKMYIIPDGNLDEFMASIASNEKEKGAYKVDEKDVLRYNIQIEALDDYVS